MVRPETFESVLDLVLAENKEIGYLLIISDDKKAAKAILHSANTGIKFDNARILTSQHVVRAVANNIKKSTLNFKPSQIDLLSTLLDQVRIQWWSCQILAFVLRNILAAEAVCRCITDLDKSFQHLQQGNRNEQKYF